MECFIYCRIFNASLVIATNIIQNLTLKNGYNNMNIYLFHFLVGLVGFKFNISKNNQIYKISVPTIFGIVFLLMGIFSFRVKYKSCSLPAPTAIGSKFIVEIQPYG